MEQAPEFLHLRISGHPAYVSRVLEASHDGFLARSPVDDGVAIVPAAGTPVDVGWMTTSGTVAWHAGVATEAEARGDAWTFRIQMLDGPVMVERRRHPRAQVALEAEIAPVLGAAPVHATVLDIGAGGVRVRVSEPLAVGDVVQLAIFPPGLRARAPERPGDTGRGGHRRIRLRAVLVGIGRASRRDRLPARRGRPHDARLVGAGPWPAERFVYAPRDCADTPPLGFNLGFSDEPGFLVSDLNDEEHLQGQPGASLIVQLAVEVEDPLL